MTTDIEKAFTAISKKRPILGTYYRYVNGPQPLRYSTERLETAFGDCLTHFEINWCSVIVDATNDRLDLSGFKVEDSSANKWLSSEFTNMEIHLESQKVHKAALGYTQGYLIVWKTEDDEIEIYYNDPRLCEVFYDPESPKKKIFAAKWFTKVEQKVQEITLYYPEKLEHWQVSATNAEDITSHTKFKLVKTEVNPYGVIPVFEFYSEGEISRVTYLQDAINKIFSDMMVAGEFGAFVQRWVISQADPGDLKNGPDQIWWIPSGDVSGQGSQVGQFTPTDLASYLDAMDRLANSLFIITRTPKHYLITAGSNVSGEALLAMEAPLVKKVDWYKKRFESYWKSVIQFVLLLGGYTVETSDISAIWTKSESVQPLTEAQTAQTMVNTGMPLTTVLRRDGWNENEIAQLQADMKKEKEAKKTLAGAVLDSLRTQTAQENPTEEPAPATQTAQ